MSNAGSAKVAATDSGKDPGRLSGSMNTYQLVLSVLAFSSPLVTAAGYFALTILVSGNTAPSAFLVVTAGLLVFSVGYMAKTRRMKKTGAYYAYITAGLGKPLGLASAYVATLSYVLILIGVYAFGGITIAGLVTQFGGPEIPWWIGGLVLVGIVGILGYFNVDVSAKVLTWVMIVEVVLILVFDFGVLFQGGASGIPIQSFDMVSFAGSEPWIGCLFAILVFIGFEATVLYRDEVKNPNKTVPRATYWSVLIIGILYTFSVWMLVAAFGDGAQQAATDDLGGMFATAATNFIGMWFADTVRVLVITATLACLLSIHNASTRYLFNISGDGGLHRGMGAVHRRFKSPYRSSLVVSIVCLLTVIVYAFLGTDPGLVYAQLAGLGSTGIILLMVLVSLAVFVWFRRNPRGAGENVWNTIIAPLISILFLGGVAVYALLNYYLVVGGEPGQYNWLLLFLAIPLVAGIIVGLVMRVRSPKRYALIGGSERQD